MERKWVVIVAVIAGLLAAGLAYIFLQQQQQQLRVEEARVLVAAVDISQGAVIDYDMLAFKNVPVKFIQPGALNSRESAVGKTALVTIAAGEQVLATKLAHPRAGLTLAGKTPPGKRAVTIGLETASAVGGMLRPGDHVDILAIFSNPAVTVTLFQDVLILAVGEEMVAEAEGGRSRGVETPASRAREAITLALTPQEVQVLTVAMEQGKIRLTLRPQMEAGEALPVANLKNLPSIIDYRTLLQLYYPRVEEAGPSVEVIRGLKKEITPVPTKK